MLFRLFYGMQSQVDHALFSEIMPSLQNGSADFGVCIHEGRFTWQENDLSLVEDLGTRWEKETSCPLPLGGILASRALSAETIVTVHAVLGRFAAVQSLRSERSFGVDAQTCPGV